MYYSARKCQENMTRDIWKGCLDKPVEVRPCSEHACECVLTEDTLQQETGSTQINMIGWIEKDGQPGRTSENESVFINDTVEEDVVIHRDCNNW